MEICDCYKEKEIVHYLSEYERGRKDAMAMIIGDYSKKALNYEKRVVGHCMGQKNCPDCFCGGDKSKCDAGYFKDMTDEELRQEKIKQARRNFPNWKHYQIRSLAPAYIDSDDERREAIILNLMGRLNSFLQTKKGKFINYFTILSFSSSDFTKGEFLDVHKRGDGQYVYRGQFYSPVEMIKMANEICLEGHMDIFIDEEGQD